MGRNRNEDEYDAVADSVRSFMSYQPIYDIASLCAHRGLRQAVLCPGSRCAPLTLAFARHPDIHARTFSDERSAAFIAMGIAQRINAPAILLCTSGSAAYNFAPAVAEAFFSETPLLVITADRPPEWIGQHDGQTLHQPDVFGRHVKKSYNLPVDYDHPDAVWAINRMVNEAINLAVCEPAGPVHINAPFREPLYPSADVPFSFDESPRMVEEFAPSYALSDEQKKFITKRLGDFNKILIVAGQVNRDSELFATLNEFSRSHNIPVVADIITNLHGLDNIASHAELFLGNAPGQILELLQPDLLITFGKSVISKQVKLFLRKHRPEEHWHIQPAGSVADTFQHVTHVFESQPAQFFDFVRSLPVESSFEKQKQFNFLKLWEVEERRITRLVDEFFPLSELGEFELVREVIRNLPPQSNLHLANSMSVRYANLIGLMAAQQGITVWANRGTSGIDGCTSTAVGHSLDTTKTNVLITGDMAFFYDRNAFWHNYNVPDLRVVVLNNHGGIIFNLIDGPANLPESAEYFVTNQRLTARKLCEEFDFDYLKLDNRRKMKNLLNDFFESDGRTKILEIETDQQVNRSIFETFKQKIKQSYES